MKTVTKTGLHLSLGKKARATLRGRSIRLLFEVGWRMNTSLWTIRKFQGDIVKIAPLTGCSLSFTSDGIYFDFKTLVLHAVVHPVRLMVLEYPKSFTSYKLRKNNRHKANFPFSFSIEGGASETAFTGTIRDLSLSGVLITHSHRLTKGDDIRLNVNLAFGELSECESPGTQCPQEPGQQK